ncbi:CPBP family intramembrane glutamic endopeptidase [Clostridium sp. CTA-7]
MNDIKIIKNTAFFVTLLVVIQLLRIILKQIGFLFVERNNYTDNVATMLGMLILTVVLIFIAKKSKSPLSIFPEKFGLFYIVATFIFGCLLISTPFITCDKSIQTIILMLYSSIVTPVFEEMIFRGYVWNRLNDLFKKEWMTFIISTLLFTVWHLGYIDAIAFRTTKGVANVMIWKMITGLCFGIVLGALRLKTKNCYSTMILHGIMNIFGR